VQFRVGVQQAVQDRAVLVGQWPGEPPFPPPLGDALDRPHRAFHRADRRRDDPVGPEMLPRELQEWERSVALQRQGQQGPAKVAQGRPIAVLVAEGASQLLQVLVARVLPLAIAREHRRFDVDLLGEVGEQTLGDGGQVGELARSCTFSEYDLLFNDVLDRDAGYYQYVYGDASHWWDRLNVSFPNFHRWESYLGAVSSTVKPLGDRLADPAREPVLRQREQHQRPLPG